MIKLILLLTMITLTSCCSDSEDFSYKCEEAQADKVQIFFKDCTAERNGSRWCLREAKDLYCTKITKPKSRKRK